MNTQRPGDFPAGQHAGELFDAEARWETSNPHTKANIRYLVQRAADGEEGALDKAVAYWGVTQQNGARTDLKRIIRSAQLWEEGSENEQHPGT